MTTVEPSSGTPHRNEATTCVDMYQEFVKSKKRTDRFTLKCAVENDIPFWKCTHSVAAPHYRHTTISTPNEADAVATKRSIVDSVLVRSGHGNAAITNYMLKDTVTLCENTTIRLGPGDIIHAPTCASYEKEIRNIFVPPFLW